MRSMQSRAESLTRCGDDRQNTTGSHHRQVHLLHRVDGDGKEVPSKGMPTVSVHGTESETETTIRVAILSTKHSSQLGGHQMTKRYRIREGSIAHYAVTASPFILFVLIASICTAVTGTW